MTDRIFEALGVKDELEALSAIAATSELLTELKTITGRDAFAASIKEIKKAFSLQDEVFKATAKADSDSKPTSGEAIGTLMAWKSSFEKLPAVVTENGELKEKVRASTVEQLIGYARQTPGPNSHEHAGKMTPAMAEFFKNKSVEEVESYLKVAARVMPGERVAPKVEPKKNALSANSEGRVTTADGKTYEEMLPAARRELKEEDLDLYNAMRADWIEAGSPPVILG